MSFSTKDSRRCFSQRIRSRAAVLAATAFVAGACFGGGSGKPKTAVTPPASRPDSAAQQVAKTQTDSAAIDSAAKVSSDISRSLAVRDSAMRDSASKAAMADAAKPKPKAVGKECLLDFSESPPESRAVYYRQSATANNVFIGGGFVGHCQGEKNRVRADSAEHFAEAGFLNLFGNVQYDEPGNMKVNALHATYFTREGKLFADGNVVATQLKNGSTFSGPNMEYYRAMPNVRPQARLYAPNNPVAVLREADKGANAGPPVNLSATTIESRGDSLVYGWGNVQFTRQQVTGNSDSASFDKITGRSRLVREARIISRDKDRPFQMFGDTIDLFNSQKDRALERVLALHRGIVTSNDLKMRAERIDLRLTEQKISRAYAFGAGRATTEASGQTLIADSMDILLPGQRVQELRAVGNAVATGMPDTTKMKSDERDVLRGDTVLAYFDSLKSPADTSEKPKIREVQSRGHATSKFQIASKEGKAVPPSISYARGKFIVVAFDSGTVKNVAIDSSASGIYLEPETDSLKVDSTKKSANDTTKKAAGDTARKTVGPAKPATPPPVAPKKPPVNDSASSDSMITPVSTRRRQ